MKENGPYTPYRSFACSAFSTSPKPQSPSRCIPRSSRSTSARKPSSFASRRITYDDSPVEIDHARQSVTLPLLSASIQPRSANSVFTFTMRVVFSWPWSDTSMKLNGFPVASAARQTMPIMSSVSFTACSTASEYTPLPWRAPSTLAGWSIIRSGS